MTRTKIVISAKVPPELVGEIDQIAKLLDISTRNELIERAIRLYIGAFTIASQDIRREFNDLL